MNYREIDKSGHIDVYTIDKLPTNAEPGAFSTNQSQQAIMLMDIDELRRTLLFQSSDE